MPARTDIKVLVYSSQMELLAFIVTCNDGYECCEHQWHSQAGARALAIRGCAPFEVRLQIIGAKSTIVDRESSAKNA